MSRIPALSGIVRDAQADALLLTGEVGLTYATGMTALEGICVVFSDDSAAFITDGRYIEAAKQRLMPEGFSVRCTVSPQTPNELLGELIRSRKLRRLMYDEAALTVQDFANLRKTLDTEEFLPAAAPLRALRKIKSPDEVQCIVRAQRIAEAALDRLLPELCTGMTEREAAARLNYYMALGGSEKPSFDTILLFGENTSKPHGVPSDRRLRPGDFVLADFGAVCDGYHSDMTRTVAYGFATGEMRLVYDTVLAAQKAAMQAACAGRLCCDMHNAAASVIAGAGYGPYFTHALGHSVGLEIHETPVASPRASLPLEDGSVMTDEPGIYLAGKFGVRIEDMLLICGDTPISLTEFPKALRILPERQAE